MLKQCLTTASVIAIMATAPAIADTNYSQNTQTLNPRILADKDGDIDYPNRKTVSVNQNMTAQGMIGQDVLNQQGEAVAKVEDIIVNKDGEAEMIVLIDGEWTGMGKMVAYDYETLTRSGSNGDMMAPITEAQIDRAKSFSYDRSERNANTVVPASDSYSVSELLDAYLLNARNEQVADVVNISFKNAKADKLIVDVDENLSVTAHKVAMDFDSVELVENNNDDPQFQMSASQSQNFKNLKQSL